MYKAPVKLEATHQQYNRMVEAGGIDACQLIQFHLFLISAGLKSLVDKTEISTAFASWNSCESK